MKSNKFYIAEVAGMTLDENCNYCIPNVIGNKVESFVNKEAKYENMPLFVKDVNGFLTDVVTGEEVKLDTNVSVLDYEVLSKNQKVTNKEEVVAFALTPVKYSIVCGWIIQLDEDDVKRYVQEVKKLKKVSTNRYIQNKKNTEKEQNQNTESPYIKELMLKCIEDAKRIYANQEKEQTCKIIRKRL